MRFWQEIMTFNTQFKEFVEERLKEDSRINDIGKRGFFTFQNTSGFKSKETIFITYKGKKYRAEILNKKGFIAESEEVNSKNDINWVYLFVKHDILKKITEEGSFIIKSKQINEFRESRLMTNFDHKNNLPVTFQKNSLSILPIKRGDYLIAKFETYHSVKYDKRVVPISVNKRKDLESLDYENIYSESAALNCAFASGIIKDIIGEDCILTVNGRMSSKSFTFKIKESGTVNREVSVDNSQCEIDAGFESESKLALIEAKNTSCQDFLIRQIYYPFRLWREKISKEVVPIFMTYSNDKFSFFIYKFRNPDNYNSLKLVEQKDYVIGQNSIGSEDIKEVLFKVKAVSEPEIPFPQADKFNRIIDLLSLLVENDLSKEDITQNYDFDRRQTDYYFNAGRYLGLIEKYTDVGNVIRLRLTNKGRKIMKKNHKEKSLALVESILKHKPFKLVLKHYFENSIFCSKEKIVDLMKKSQLHKVDSDSTYFRRAQTVLKWIGWIVELIED